MRKLFVTSLMMVLAVAGDLAAQDEPANANREARQIVRQGIRAMGGREALNKAKASTWKERGTYHGMGDGLPYTGEYAIEWPGKFKMEISDVFTIVLDGKQGWMGTSGMVQELTGDELKEQQEQLHSGYVTSLLFLGEDGYKLEKLADAEVDGKPAAVVKVSHEGHRDVKLFFDPQSRLLVKAEYRLKSPELGGQEVTEEAFLRDYHEVEGLKVPGKTLLHRDGQKFVEAEYYDMTFPDKLEANVFAKPE